MIHKVCQDCIRPCYKCLYKASDLKHSNGGSYANKYEEHMPLYIMSKMCFHLKGKLKPNKM